MRCRTCAGVHGHCITPPTLWHMRPSGRTSAPPIALVRVPSELQQPLLSQLPVNVGGAVGVTPMAGAGAGSVCDRICPAAEGTWIGAW